MLEAPFEISNLSPKSTGLPFVVWISVRSGMFLAMESRPEHDVHVHVSPKAKATLSEMTAVAVRPDVRIISGRIDADGFALLKRWIELNRDTLVSYWEGEFDTQDALELLRKV
jgi:hypothetical protein